MSVILDVLRKLDRDKSSRRSAAANIALEILKSDPPRSPKRNSLYFAAIGATAFATAAITYTLMGFGFLSKSTAPGSVNPPTASQEVAQVQLYSGSPSTSSLPPAKSPPVSSQKVTPAPPALDQPESPAPSSRKVTSAPLPPESSRDARDNQAPPEVRAPAENKIPAISPGEKEASPTLPQQTPDKSAVILPSLKISAIIWYEDPSRRFAMINDTMTHEGSVIEDVKVEEIHPNRVRFSHNGRHFEISVK